MHSLWLNKFEKKHPSSPSAHVFLISLRLVKRGQRRPTCQLATQPLKQTPSYTLDEHIWNVLPDEL